MVNKRLIELAKRQMNPILPVKRTILTSNLTQVLERDENGKPILKLNPMEETVVHTPTKEEYYILMQVYECGGWRWNNAHLPTKLIHWETEKETFINAGVNFANPSNLMGFRHGHRESFPEGVISIQEFYDAQKITPKVLKEINQYFEKQDGK